MTELALQRTAADAVSAPCLRFAGKSLEAMLAAVASELVEELRRDVVAAVVARDRHGAWIYGYAGQPGPDAVGTPMPSHKRVITAALDDARPTHTARLIGVPVAVDGRIVAALMACAAGSRSLDATDWAQSNRAARRWGVTLDNATAFAAASERANHLEIAMAGRAIIEQAKGVLMQRERCDAAHAFEILRDISQRGDAKLAAVAAQIVADAQD